MDHRALWSMHEMDVKAVGSLRIPRTEHGSLEPAVQQVLFRNVIMSVIHLPCFNGPSSTPLAPQPQPLHLYCGLPASSVYTAKRA